MTIITNAQDRKKLVNEISEHLGIPAVYLRTPTYAFQIGNLTINRDASISADDPAEIEAIKPLLLEKGYIDSQNEEPEKIQEIPETQETEAEHEIADIIVGHLLEGLPTTALRNLIYIFYSKQTLLNHAIGHGKLKISEAVVEQLKNELPNDVIEFCGLINRLRDSGDICGLECRHGEIHINYGVAEAPNAYYTYLYLTNKIIEFAKKATRVFPEHQQPESEKYVMRSWLVRLGMGGTECKSLRHNLLKNLSGHSAFPTEAAAQKHKDKYAQIRRDLRANAVATPEEDLNEA